MILYGTTPKKINKIITDFARSINSDEYPRYIPVKPALKAKKYCFLNVLEHIKQYMGRKE